jgi:heme/copper-type cytochrome/quinol oxidase subunit 3
MQIPYTVERRSDTGVNNVTLGIWLFLSSEVMLFGSLFSAYVFLRIAAPHWPRGLETLNLEAGSLNTILMLAATFCIWRARALGASGRGWLWLNTAAAAFFLVIKSFEWSQEIGRGWVPSLNTFLATYFTLTGLHGLHVIAGIIANMWAATGLRRVGPAMTANRLSALALYWTFVDVVWIIIFVLMYVL